MKLKYYLRGLGIGIVVTAIIMSFTRQPEKLTDAQIKMRALELGMVEKNVLADLQPEEESDNEENVVEKSETLEEVSGEEEAVEDSIIEETTSEETKENDSESAAEETSNEETAGNDSESVTEETTSEETKGDVSESAAEETSNEETAGNKTESVEKSTDDPNLVVEDSNIEGSNINTKEEIVENYIVISVISGNGSEIVSQRLYEAGLVNSAVEYNQFLVKNGYDRKLRVGNHEIPAGATEEEMARILCGMQ